MKKIPSSSYDGQNSVGYNGSEPAHGDSKEKDGNQNNGPYSEYERRLKSWNKTSSDGGRSDVNGQRSGSGIVDVFKAVPISGSNTNNLVHSGSGNIFLYPQESSK